MFRHNLKKLRDELADNDLEAAIITDDDSVYYFTGYFDYLHMEFGRPTILIVPRGGESLLITPGVDLNMARTHARVDRIATWNDGLGDEWRAEIPRAVSGMRKVAIETRRMPPLVRLYLDTLIDESSLVDVTPLVSEMRMIKSEQELQLARHAGEVANVMMNAGREAIAHGIPEYEVALATSRAGTRKAAELLARHYDATEMSPNTHFLQIMASGEDIIKTHHRASTRIMNCGEPVFLCFCGMTDFHRFKLGFDRTFWIDVMPDTKQREVYQIAVDSQAAALKVLRPGITAEEVHAEYAEVIQSAGYDYPFRCGRGTGFSFLEQPQLVSGDKTVLQANMVFAVDGSVSTPTFRAQVGDSFILNDLGHEQITRHPTSLEEVIIKN